MYIPQREPLRSHLVLALHVRSHLNLTKLDVLTGLKEIKLGVKYHLHGVELNEMPASLRDFSECEVEYEVTTRGWNRFAMLAATSW